MINNRLFRKLCYVIAIICSANLQTVYSQINPNAFWSNQFNLSTNGTIFAIAIDNFSGDIYVGGSFDTIQGVAANNIAKWDGTSWYALGSGTNGTVRALSFITLSGAAAPPLVKSSKSLTGVVTTKRDKFNVSTDLFVGGDFTEAGGLSVGYFAKYSSGAGWAAITDFSNTGANGRINAITLYENGSDIRIYFGGNFSQLNGPPIGGGAIGKIAYWNDFISSYSYINGLNGVVNALVTDGIDLYAGGAFTQNVTPAIFPAPTPLNLNYVARYNGSTWDSLGTSAGFGTNGTVNAMALYGGNLYAGGSFSQAGTIGVNNIAMWDSASWLPLGSGLNGDVYGLAVDGSGNLYAVGNFTIAGGVPANNIAKWDGSSWSAIGNGLNSTGNATIVNGVNVYAGGNFTQAGTFSSNSFAHYFPQSYLVDGTVLSKGYPQSGVTVSLTGPYNTSVTTDGSGKYNFSVGTFGTYSVTPSLENYGFLPQNLYFTDVSTDLYDNNFISKVQKSSISCNIENVKFDSIGYLELPIDSVITIRNQPDTSESIPTIATITSIYLETVDTIFQILQNTPVTVSPYDSTTITIRYKPNRVGTFTNILHIINDSYNNSHIQIPLKGKTTGSHISAPLITDFGIKELLSIPQDTIIKISNTGNYPLIINSVTLSHINTPIEITSAFPSSGVFLNPGETYIISLRLKTRILYHDSIQLIIQNNSSNNPTLAIPILGQVENSSLVLLPSEIDFGTTSVITPKISGIITAQNYGTKDIKITGKTLIGDTTSFKIINNVLPKTIAVNSKDSLNIEFFPHTAGIKLCSLKVSYINPLDSQVVDLFVYLKGTGDGKPTLEVNSDPLDFGDVGLNSYKDTIIIIKNSGNLNLIISSITFGGTDKNLFTFLKASTTVTLQMGETDTLKVRFSSASPLGDKVATLQVLSNDQTKSFNIKAYIKSPIIGSDLSKIIWPEHYTGTNNDTIVTIKNAGNDILQINNIFTDGQTLNDFTLPELQLPITIMPQNESAIKVRFNPIIAGTRFARIIIMSNDPVNPELPIPLRGTGVKGTPKIVLLKDTLNFEPIPFGLSTTAILTIMNHGTDTLKITDMNFSGTNFSNFVLPEISYPILIPINSEKQITLKFSSYLSGDNFAKLNIFSNDTITKIKTIIMHGICLGKPIITLSSEKIDYGIIEKGESKDNKISIINKGDGGLRIDSIKIIGNNKESAKADFKIPNTTFPILINPSDSTILTVSYTPFPQTTTRSSAILQIYSDDQVNSKKEVSLNGIATTILVSPKTLNFGITSIDSPMTVRRVLLTNSSNTELLIKNRIISDTNIFKFLSWSQSSTLSAGQTDTIIIQFCPHILGTKTATLTITTSDTITPTFVVKMSGVGAGRPKIFVSTEKINFGFIRIGEVKDTNILIRNDGNLDLQISGKKFIGTDKDIFVFLDGGLSKTLQYSQIENVKFRIVGKLPAGNKSGQLQINNNDNDRNILNIDLLATLKTPVITLSVNRLNLDTVSIRDTSKADFNIKNIGNDTLSIQSFRIEGELANDYSLSGYKLPLILLPNEIKDITISYRPSKVGTSKVSILIGSNDLTNPASKIEITGTGKKSNVIIPNTQKINLGILTINRSKDTSIILTNADIEAVWIKALKIIGDTSQFDVPPIDSFKIDPSGSKSILIRYTPKVEGQTSCILEIIPSDTSINQKIEINITGICIVPILSTQSVEINFSNVRVNTKKDTIFTIENKGQGILDIKSIFLVGKDSLQFKINQISLPIEIFPGGKTGISISYLPSGTGDKFASLIVNNNDPKNQQKEIKISGKGTEPSLTVSSTKIDMGSIFTLSRKDTSLNITNSGTDPLYIKRIYTSGLDSTKFSLIGLSLPLYIKPNESMRVILQFYPQTKGIKGTELRIESDDPNRTITKIALSGEGTIPKLNLISDLIAEENQDKTIIFKLSEFHIPNLIRIFYKKGNINLFDSTTILPSGTENNSFTFAKNLITKDGLDFYIKYIWDGLVVTLPDSDYTDHPSTFQILIKNYENVISVNTKIYSMFTVPLFFNNTNLIQEIIANLGPYNNSKWRVFRLSGSEYFEYSDGATDNLDILPGDGFWLISSENKSLTFHNCLTVPTNNEYRIWLQPGWNQIGSPFTFVIPISGMTIPGNKRVERTLWNWTSEGEYSIENQYFSPWVGYFIKNNEADSVDIYLNPKSVSGMSKITNKISESKLNEREWKYQIVIKNIGNNLTTSNNLTEFGCLTNSKENWDMNDVSEPPLGPYGAKSIYSCIRFPHTEWEECKGNYIRDYRGINTEGNTWEMELEKSNPFFSGQQYELILNKEGEISQGNKLLIYDYDNMNLKEYDVTEQIGHKFNSSSETGIKKLKIIVGTEQYVNEKRIDINKEVSKIPVKTYLLKQNYPNPFNPETSIEYEIPKGDNVKISIYNVLGQEIQTLINKYQEPGRYSIDWNPTEKSLPTGLYFYKLTAGTFNQMKKMLYIR